MSVAAPVQPVARAPRRFGWLDVARGLAALCVLLQHSLEGAGYLSLEQGAFATTWLNLGETGVAIFFLVSGFIIPASVKGRPRATDFWIRRALRIYPLYFFVFLLTLALSLLVLRDPLPPMGETIALHLVFVQEWIGTVNYVGGSWTLFIELLWYICFAGAFFTGLATGARLIWLFLAAYAGITVLAAFVAPQDFAFGRMSLFALCFMGYAYLLRFEEQIGIRHFVAIMAAFLTVIGTSIVVGFALYPSTGFAQPAFACVAISWSLALVAFPVLLTCRHRAFAELPALRYLGEISYSVYLLHSPIIVLLIALGLAGMPFVLVTFALALALATQTYRYVEQPGIALARRITRNRARSIPAEVERERAS